MGERPGEQGPGRRRTEDDVTRREAGYSPRDQEGGRAREMPAYDSGAEDAAAIERDIDRTRAEMSETIDALGERLSPKNIKQQAKYSIQSTAREAQLTMMETIRQNPVPSLIAGLSVGWLIRKGTDGSSRRAAPQAYSQRPGFYRAEPYRQEDMGTRVGGVQSDSGTQSMREQAGEAADKAQHKAEQYRDEASQKARQYGEQASHTAQQISSQAQQAGHKARHQMQQAGHQAQHQMQRVGHQAQRQARRATDRADQMLRENPLGMGVLTAAVGAAVGLALPSTRTEDELMGNTRDQMVRQAKSTAKEKMEKAQDVAEKTAEEAKETAKEEAEEKDLTS